MPSALLEFLKQFGIALGTAGSIEAISNSFDDTSKEICQCLAIINETLLQIRDGIKASPGAEKSKLAFALIEVEA